MRVTINKIASVTRNLRLNREATLAPTVEAAEGAVVAARVLNEKSVYNQLEDVHGRMTTLHPGDIIAGALGQRNALHGYEGIIPKQVERGDTLNLLNLGGVIGQCLSHNPAVGKPFEIEVLGQVLLYPNFQSRKGEPAFVSMGALERRPLAVGCPVVFVAGTCMNSGKTAAACALVRRLTQDGLRVGGAKLTGVALMKDALGMRDYGAAIAYDFTDAGYVSTTPDTAPIIARTLLTALAAEKVDVIVAEMGDGILGEYGVHAILDDADVRALLAGFVLCANDPVGVYGAVKLLHERYGVRPDVIAGPATDNKVGTRFIEREISVPAINARTDAQHFGEFLSAVLRQRGGGAAP